MQRALYKMHQKQAEAKKLYFPTVKTWAKRLSKGNSDIGLIIKYLKPVKNKFWVLASKGNYGN